MSTTKIRPGLLIALTSRVAGGVRYTRTPLESPDERSARWETLRTVEDPEERDRALQTRSLALRTIRGVCASTAFGLLCPEDREADLDAAVVTAMALRAEHNATAKTTRVELYLLKGRIAASDEEAARAIGSEVASMIDAMNSGIDRLDPKAIREAATKARELAGMLGPETAETVASAIEAARRAARQIVARVEKGGELAAVVLADIQRGAIERARIAFLDADDVVQAGPGEALPAVDLGRVAALDVESGSAVDLDLMLPPIERVLGQDDNAAPTPPPVSIVRLLDADAGLGVAS